jgi:hypothetical protein
MDRDEPDNSAHDPKIHQVENPSVKESGPSVEPVIMQILRRHAEVQRKAK